MTAGEPLADELNLQVALQKDSVAKATEEKSAVAKPVEPSESVPTKQERSKKPAFDAAVKTEEIKRAAARETSSERESKSLARSSMPKSDGTRSLIRTLGLKVGRIVIDAGHADFAAQDCGDRNSGTIFAHGIPHTTARLLKPVSSAKRCQASPRYPVWSGHP